MAPPPAASEWSASRVFSAVDSDGSGTIDLSELSVAVTASAGRPVKEKEARKILEKWDTNEDGVLGGFRARRSPPGSALSAVEFSGAPCIKVETAPPPLPPLYPPPSPLTYPPPSPPLPPGTSATTTTT
jgi:hypothetical protein